MWLLPESERVGWPAAVSENASVTHKWRNAVLKSWVVHDPTSMRVSSQQSWFAEHFSLAYCLRGHIK